MRKRSGFGHVCGFVFSYYLAQTRTLKLTTLPFDSKVNLKLILQYELELNASSEGEIDVHFNISTVRTTTRRQIKRMQW